MGFKRKTDHDADEKSYADEGIWQGQIIAKAALPGRTKGII